MKRWNEPLGRTGTSHELRKVDTQPLGSWIIITCHSEYETQLSDIRMQRDPLSSFKYSQCAPLIVSRLRSDAHLWLASETLGSMRIPSDFFVVGDKLVSSGSSTYSEIVSNSLKVVFAHVKLAAWLHTRNSSRDYHLEWIVNESELPLLQADEPQTTIYNALQNIDSHGVEALLRLMRIPTHFEGGTDFMFEKLVQVAMKLLFESEDTLFLKCVDGVILERPTPTFPVFPLVISGASFEWDNVAQECFALHARATLIQLVRISPQRKPLPEHYIVYGIHCVSDKLRIIAHFPLKVEGEDEGQWEFAQVMVAEHWISIMELPQGESLLREHVDDDAIIDRWRISVALFTIRYHIRHLKETFRDNELCISRSTVVTVPPSDVDMYPTVTPAISVYPHCSEAFKKLKDHWRSSKLSVPESWIPFEQVIIQLLKREDESWPQTPDRHIPAILSQLVLHPLRHLLAPISNEKIWQNHISNDYQGPDFIHRLHIPRSHTIWKPATESNIDTEPYLNRCYDFITMAAQTWDEINMFIANTFSNFADYSVLWHPFAGYSEIKTVKKGNAEEASIDTIDYYHGNIIMDFALSIRTIAASTVFTIKRGPRLSLTPCSPAALVGLRMVDMADDDNHISEGELTAIRNLMAIHLRPVQIALKLANPQDVEWATVFCTYLKCGFVHLLACKPVPGVDELITVEVVDSLPVRMRIHQLDELEDRMRLVIALFTLQKHVVRFASRWCDIPLPGELMDREHLAIHQVTRMPTPSVSDDEEY